MNLSKKQRDSLKMKYSGRCAYCGVLLGEKWHADHIEAVGRQHKYIKGKGFVATGKMNRPGNDHLLNLNPSCIACNIDKHDYSIESWRRIIQGRVATLNASYSAYRHAKRFGLVLETGAKVIFFFETYTPPRRRLCPNKERK